MISIFRFAIPVAFATTLISLPAAQSNQNFPRSINQRQNHQQARIFNGVKNDQLSQKEYQNLQRRSLSIEHQQRRDIRDGGGLTPRERYQLNQRLNHVSQSIYRDRHN